MTTEELRKERDELLQKMNKLSYDACENEEEECYYDEDGECWLLEDQDSYDQFRERHDAYYAEIVACHERIKVINLTLDGIHDNETKTTIK